MALNAIFSITCPCCGAKNPVYSATSVIIVCEYCNSTLERYGEEAVDTGKKSALLEDYSPLQIHTSGVYHGEPFTIIGLLQIQYSRGFWNEWYILFNNGKTAWLADFSGQYVITMLDKPLAKPIAFKNLVAGQTFVSYGKSTYIASDVRRAKRIKANARGELPFKLKEDEDYLVADLRCRELFMTLDYSEGEHNPQVYTGKAVELKNLRCQNLRSDTQIMETAGHLKGERAALKCPNCGYSLNWYPGVAHNIICPSCHSEVVMDEKKPKVLRPHTMREMQSKLATLKLGEEATINGTRWTIIGFVRVQETVARDAFNHINGQRNSVTPESAFWHEYLLYNLGKGFIWLVETSDNEWSISHSASVWPAVTSNNTPLVSGSSSKTLRRLYDYGGIVSYAAGAFYWRIEPQDVTYYQDYQYDKGKMSAERTREELNWSISKPVTGQELAQWFKKPELAKAVSKSRHTNPNRGIAILILVIFAIVNLPAAIQAMGSEESLIGLAVISFIVYSIIWAPFKENDDD